MTVLRVWSDKGDAPNPGPVRELLHALQEENVEISDGPLIDIRPSDVALLIHYQWWREMSASEFVSRAKQYDPNRVLIAVVGRSMHEPPIEHTDKGFLGRYSIIDLTDWVSDPFFPKFQKLVKACRKLTDQTESIFKTAVERALGDRIRADDKIACDMWCALANVDWRHRDGDTASYSFRVAGHFVASIRGSGTYMDWYCCENSGYVTQEIARAMAAEGWTFESLENKY
jgi:hypothetical protein